MTPFIPRKGVHLERFSPRKVADQFVGPPEKQEQRETVIGHLTISSEIFLFPFVGSPQSFVGFLVGFGMGVFFFSEFRIYGIDFPNFKGGGSQMFRSFCGILV